MARQVPTQEQRWRDIGECAELLAPQPSVTDEALHTEHTEQHSHCASSSHTHRALYELKNRSHKNHTSIHKMRLRRNMHHRTTETVLVPWACDPQKPAVGIRNWSYTARWAHKELCGDINSLRGLAHAPMDVASEMVSEIESEMGLDSLSIYWRKHGSNRL